MTDVIAYTNQDILNDADPNLLPDALRKVGLGNVLEALTVASEVTDTGVVPATPFAIALSATPIPGTLRVASAAVVQHESVSASAIAATQYKLSVSGGVTSITFHSGTETETYVAKYLTLDTCGPDGDTPIKTILDAEFADGGI